MDIERPKRTNAPMKPKEIKGEKMELIVFTNNGQTYHFFEVTDFKPTTVKGHLKMLVLGH